MDFDKSKVEIVCLSCPQVVLQASRRVPQPGWANAAEFTYHGWKTGAHYEPGLCYAHSTHDLAQNGKRPALNKGRSGIYYWATLHWSQYSCVVLPLSRKRRIHHDWHASAPTFLLQGNALYLGVFKDNVQHAIAPVYLTLLLAGKHNPAFLNKIACSLCTLSWRPLIKGLQGCGRLKSESSRAL